MTRQAIQLAGSPDVCSICGDDPVSDYYLPAKYRSASGVDMLRLYEDCLQISYSMGGTIHSARRGGWLSGLEALRRIILAGRSCSR